MASRSLGSLTIDLIAKIGGFTQGMTEAERVADKKTREMQRKMDARRKEIVKAWDGMSRVLAAGFAGITFGAVFNKVITETRAAEREQALLAAALKATGQQAGYSQVRLNEMAAVMEGLTGIAGGELNQAQTVLLGFTNIVGEQLPKALQATADFSVRTGVTMAAAAETIGRALDIPSVGMASLSKQGFKFSESQVEAARQLERTGQIAQAQQLVLDALNETYGGAAEAARDTFGGSLQGLQSTINSLLTGDSGSFDQAKMAIDDLNKQLGSEQTRAAFQQYITWLAKITTYVVELSTEFSLGIRYADGFWDALFKYGTTNPFKSASDQLTGLRQQLKDAEEDAQKAQWLKSDALKKQDAEKIRGLNQQIGYWQEMANSELDKKNAWWVKNQRNRGTPSVVAPDLTPRTVGVVNLKDVPKPKGGKSQAEKDQEAAERFLQSMRDQVQKSQERTAWEQLHYDIQAKGLKLSQDQLNQAQGLATLMDMAKEAEQARSTEIDRQNTLYQLQERLMNAQQQHQLELLTYGMGDQAAAELRERMALEQKQQAELRQMQHEHGQEMRAAETEAERNHLQTLFDERYRLTQEALAQEVRLFDEAAAAKRAKERDGVLGAKSALDTYVRDAQNAYGMTKQVVTNALGGMEDALVSFITTGKLDFNSLANSIVADITRIIIKQQLSNALGVAGGSGSGGGLMGLIGAGIGLFGGTSAVASTASAMPGDALDNFLKLKGFATGGYTGAGGKYEPAGVVHRGEGVLSQRDVAALGGPRAFEQFRASLHHGYSGGGYVRGYVTPSSPALPAVRPAASAGAQPLVVNVQMPQGASRETALQFGRTVGQQIQLAQRRNG